MDRFDLQEVVASLELGCSKGYSGTAMDSMSSDLPDAVGDVLQAGGDGVATSIHRPGGGGCYGVKGLDL